MKVFPVGSMDPWCGVGSPRYTRGSLLTASGGHRGRGRNACVWISSWEGGGREGERQFGERERERKGFVRECAVLPLV